MFVRDVADKSSNEFFYREFRIKGFIGSEVFEIETDVFAVIGSDSGLSDNRALGVASDVSYGKGRVR